MWSAGVDDEQVVLGDVVFASGHLAPAISLSAVDEDDLRASLLANAYVPLGFWVISGVRRQQMLQQRRFQGVGQDRPWHHHQTLPGKSLMLLTPLHSQ